MVILGIDPGLANTGWGIVEERRGEVRCRAYGCIHTEALEPLDQRLRAIVETARVVGRYGPEAAAVESIYFGANRPLRHPHGPCARRSARGVLACRSGGG